MCDNTPLSTADLAGYLQATHAELYPAEAALCTYALHGARIGRIQSMKAAGGTSAQLRLMNLPGGAPAPLVAHPHTFVGVSAGDDAVMNKVSGHTQSSGRISYDSSQLADEISLLRAANDVSVLPMDTVHRFVRDGTGDNDAVSVVRDEHNQFQVVKNRLEPLPVQTRVITTATRSTASKPRRDPKPVLKSAPAIAAAGKFRATANAAVARAVGLPSEVTHSGSTSVVVGSSELDTGSPDDNGAAVPTGNATAGAVLAPTPSVAAAPTAGRVVPPRSPVRAVLPVLPAFSTPVSPALRRSKSTAHILSHTGTQPSMRSTHRLCEDCQLKSANYGVAASNFVRRWCGKCGRKHGATKPPGKAGHTPPEPPRRTGTLVDAFARAKKAKQSDPDSDQPSGQAAGAAIRSTE
jgi:hypothetical protein